MGWDWEKEGEPGEGGLDMWQVAGIPDPASLWILDEHAQRRL